MENFLILAIVVASGAFCWRRVRRIWKAPEKGCGCDRGCGGAGGCGAGRMGE